ncbi:MAG: cobyrinate a,c-diamide synthase [Nitrospirota bacterium]
MHGVVIAGTHSGCGKTTVTLGILAALKKKGLSVQSFKAGPDFIDAGLHKLITGRTSRNLDLYMCGEDYVRDCFQKYSADTDISVVEGVMGLYDGKLSTASLAHTLNLPVILVVDAYGMAESAGAVVKGFTSYKGQRDKGTKGQSSKNSELCFAGVIFNRVASENHFKRLKESVHDVPVLGYLPRELNFEIPHRHLGLTVAEEEPISAEAIDRLADAVLKHVDVDTVAQQHTLRQAQGDTVMVSLSNHDELPSFRTSGLKVAVAYDKAFCFYYEDNLDLLREARAEILLFSPLSDSKIPDDADALYIGGGYPEIYAEQLSGNKSMLASVKNWSDEGKPVYAECGGFMYLTEGIWTNKRAIDNNPLPPFSKGEFYEMAGIFPFETQMKAKLSKLGYREAVLKQDSILGEKGMTLRGHEFHYSEIADRTQNTEPKTHIYKLKDGAGNALLDEGYMVKNTFGSYIHIHFGSNKKIAGNFINFCKGITWK